MLLDVISNWLIYLISFRIWTKPLAQEQLLAFALDTFEQGISSAQTSIAFINFWYHYFQKFLRPLLLSVGHETLTSLAVRSIIKWTQNLEVCERVDGITATQWLCNLLNRGSSFYLLVVLYNRLPKTCLHGMSDGGVGSVLKTYIGPSRLDQIKGTELTAVLIK